MKNMDKIINDAIEKLLGETTDGITKGTALAEEVKKAGDEAIDKLQGVIDSFPKSEEETMKASKRQETAAAVPNLVQVMEEVQRLSKELEELKLPERFQELEDGRAQMASHQDEVRQEIQDLTEQERDVAAQIRQLQGNIDQKLQTIVEKQVQFQEQLTAQQAQTGEYQKKLQEKLTMTVAVAAIVIIAAGVIMKLM